MILITGATGYLGAAVIENLLREVSPSEIAIYARDGKKAQRWEDLGLDIRIGDYDNEADIKNACLGIDKLLLIPVIARDAFLHHKNVIDVAIESGVKYLYFASGAFDHSVEKSELGMLKNSFIRTENYLRQTGIPHTIFHNGLFMDTIPILIGEHLPINGINFPSGHGKSTFATMEDVSEAMAKLILKKNDVSTTYVLTGNESYSFIDVANLLSDISGHEILFLNSSEETFTAALVQAEAGESQIALSKLFSRIIKNSEYALCDRTLEQILQRKPTTLKDYLQKTYLP